MMHIMIDLETFSLRKNCVISEVGAVLFDPAAPGTMETIIGKTWLLNMQEQIDNKRDINIKTVQWWMQQDEKARMKIVNNDMRLNIRAFLEDFRMEYDWDNITGVWSNDINFDLVILEELYREYKQEPPWHYRTPRSTRTLFWLVGMEDKKEHIQPIIKHSAAHDAVACALTVQKAIAKLAGISGGLKCTNQT